MPAYRPKPAVRVVLATLLVLLTTAAEAAVPGALVFAYEVADGESDTDGVGVEADSLSGGTIRDEARNNAELDHDGLAADSGNKVDAVKPQLVATGGAVVDGTRLTLTYDEPLDKDSQPAAGVFGVTVDTNSRNVNAVAVSGSEVMLTLPSTVTVGQTVTVSYTPGTHPIRDLAGNPANALTDEPVTNQTRTNVVLITADDMNWDAVGVFGSPIAGTTPNIDQLGAEGLRFNHGHMTASECHPSRSALMTGRYPHLSGGEGFHFLRLEGVPILPDILRDAGYDVGILGKVRHSTPYEEFQWDLMMRSRELGYGRNPEAYYQNAKNFVQDAMDGGRPFFLMANSNDPHRPFYGNDTSDWYDELDSPAVPPSRTFAPEEVVVPGFLPDIPEVRLEISEYYSSVRRADDTVGRLLDVLDDTGVAENTLVMFLSDQGMAFPFAKTNTYLNSTRTPWVVRWPGVIQAGRVDAEHFISGIDYLPTVLDAIGVDIPEGVNGKSFLPILRGEKQDGREYVFTQLHRTSGHRDYPIRSVQNARFGYVFNLWSNGEREFINESQQGRSWTAMQWAGLYDTELAARNHFFAYRVLEEFYDYENDPNALNNLIDDPDYADEIQALRDTLEEWMVETNDWILEVFRNPPPTVSSVAFTSDPGADNTYKRGDVIDVTVTFSGEVAVTGRPQIDLTVGSTLRTANYVSGSGTTQLVFRYRVQSTDEDTNGATIKANGLKRNRGSIKNNNSTADAILTHGAQTNDPNHKADGVRPSFPSAAVDGSSLTLTYGEALDEGSRPAPGDFTVQVDGSGRSVSAVSVSGRVVALTLNPAVEHGEKGIMVSYTPGTNPIRDAAGNEALGLINWSVGNEAPDTTPPAVSTIEITSDPGTDATYAAEDEIRVTLTFSETVEVTGTPQLTLELGGGSRTANYGGGSGTAALVFAYEVAVGESDTDGVGVEADSLSGGTIRDEARNNAELDHDGLAADSGHKVDAVKPQLAATGGAVVDGTRLTLTYDEALDGGSRPVSGDFTVSGGDRARTVTGVRVNGSAVQLTLDVGAEHLEAGILVSYTPGDNPIRDVPGNDAEALSREPVTNDTPDTTPPEVSSLAITSNPGGDQTYAAEDEIEVTVTFDETVVVTGRPRLFLKMGRPTKPATYDRSSNSDTLVFVYEVAVGDEDTDGVSIEAGRIDRNGGTIKDEADNDAVLDHEAVAPQAGHKVDGVRPAFVSAAVDGSSLTLTYGEALDEGSRPASGDFTVQVDGSGRSVSGVSVSGRVVTLTLNPLVEHGDTGIRVSYTPDTNPIRDAVGNDARGLSSQSVTNTTGAPNTAPEITSPSSFDVPENQAMVRRLAARDTDPGDEVTGWEIVGGADQGQFTITSDTGELSFRTAPDYEAPGDNEYEVTVEVRSGAGARELEAEQTFTLRVTDEREPPGIPEAPTFSGETAESMTVNWSEPDNTGPEITDYDVQYREGGSGGFINAQHEGPGLTATLTGLKEGTVYEVQVRARNDEGMSDWSESGEGMTVTPLTVEITSNLPPPVEGSFTVRFSFSETVVGFTRTDITTQQEPACTDSGNNPVFCNPSFAALQTTDDRIFTTAVTPRTDQVAHNYTLTLTVPAGRVTSAAGNKPNEEAMLEVRVAPPGVTVPISSLGLTASAGNAEVRLNWNRPTEDGGSAIIRYEYRFAAAGEDFSAWENVRAGTRRVTVGVLFNGTEYVFEVRAVNALGKGETETVSATPDIVAPPPPPPPPTGNKRPTADAGPDQTGVWEGALVTLDGSGSSDPDDDPLRYRWNQLSGESVVLLSQNVVNPTFTAPQGLTADAVLSFRLLVTDPEGHFDSDTVTVTVDPEAEPPPPEDWIYYFPHLAVGARWQTTITYINYSSQEVSCTTEFLSDHGSPLLVSFADRGTVPSRTDVLLPGGSVHQETNVDLSAPLAPGWARAACAGPVKASLLFRLHNSEGVPVAEAGVNAAIVPATRFVTFAEQGEGKQGTGVAYANPSDTEALITFTARDADGEVLAIDDLMLSPNGHGAQNMAPLFGLSSFTGSLEVTSPEPIVSLSLNAEAAPVFSSLPPGELDAAAQGTTTYYFPHLAVGARWQTTITYINYSSQEVSCTTEFLSDHGSPLLVSFADRGTVVSRTDVLPPGGSVHEETNVELSAPLARGWARATCSGPVKASLLYRRRNSEGVPTGEAGVNAVTVPATRFITFAEQGEGQFGTGVAYANPSDTTTAFATFTVRDADGEMLASVDETLLPNGHDAKNMVDLFGLGSFTGSLEITSTVPIVSLSLNNEADPVFSSLPPGEVDAAAQGTTMSSQTAMPATSTTPYR